MLLKIRNINLQTSQLPSPPPHLAIKQVTGILEVQKGGRVSPESQMKPSLKAISCQLKGRDIKDKIPLGSPSDIYYMGNNVAQYLREAH